MMSSTQTSLPGATLWHRKCWSCAAEIEEQRLFCDFCGKIQPPAPDPNYFAIFGLPRKLNLDITALERDFYKLSRKLHPDIFARATEREQESSLANSSLLNDAYRTLKNPVSRTEYLLRLEGVAIGEESARDKKQERAPADLLEEVFELNMQLEEMRANQKVGEDDPQLRSDLTAAKVTFDGRMVEANQKLTQLWHAWDQAIDAGDEPRKDALKQQMVALLDRRRYLRNLVRDVNEALEG